MDATIAHDGLAGVYPILRHQARAARAAADAQIAALRDEMEHAKRSRESDDDRRREDLRFALACEAARVGELVAHRYRIIPMEYGPGRLETIARSACDVFKIRTSSILRDSAGASMLLDKEIVAAAAMLDDAVDALNSLLTVEGALGRLPAVELMNAYEAVTEAVKRLRVATMNDAEAARAPHRVSDLLRAAQ